MALINIVAAGVWHFMGADSLRWVYSGGILAVAYALLGRGLMNKQKLGKRTYRYAE